MATFLRKKVSASSTQGTAQATNGDAATTGPHDFDPYDFDMGFTGNIPFIMTQS